MSNDPNNILDEVDSTLGPEPLFLTVSDEDGNEFELEYVETVEYNGHTYMAFFPADDAEGEDGEPQDVDLDEESGLIIMKVIDVDGEEQLSLLDSDEELELVYQQFMEVLFEEEDQ